jgi:hypothetical protein
MDTTTLIIIVVVAVVLVVLIAAAVWQRRSSRLKQRFGPEYERVIGEAGGRRRGESELREREKRHEELDLRPLSAEASERYRTRWEDIQNRFVDEPGQAVEDADQLVVRIMRDRGYPVDDFDQRADDISVEHPDVAQYYRKAHGVAVDHRRGGADTEQLRESVVSYRSLVTTLLEERGAAGGDRR